MTHLLNHFSLQASNWNSLVLLALLIIWAGVLGCVISSIITQPFDRKQRIFWISLVVFVPLFGVLAYLPFAFHKEELPHVLQRKKKRTKRERDSTRHSISEP